MDASSATRFLLTASLRPTRPAVACRGLSKGHVDCPRSHAALANRGHRHTHTRPHPRPHGEMHRRQEFWDRWGCTGGCRGRVVGMLDPGMLTPIRTTPSLHPSALSNPTVQGLRRPCRHASSSRPGRPALPPFPFSNDLTPRLRPSEETPSEGYVQRQARWIPDGWLASLQC